jgi:hypothetical protein
MQSRGEKGSTRVGNPPETASGTPLVVHTPSSSDHNFFLQIAMDIQRSIGKLEASNQSLASTSDKHAEKLDAVAEQLHTAKGMMTAFGWTLSALGALGLLLLGTILTVLLKHFNLL